NRFFALRIEVCNEVHRFLYDFHFSFSCIGAYLIKDTADKQGTAVSSCFTGINIMNGLCAACNVTLQTVPCLFLLLFFRFGSLFHPFHGSLEAVTPVMKFIKSVLVCVQGLVVALAVEFGRPCHHWTGTS